MPSFPETQNQVGKIRFQDLDSYVIRRIKDMGKDPSSTDPNVLAAPEPMTLGNFRDAGLIRLLTNFGQRQGHTQWGLMQPLAEAWGMDVLGEFCLCLSRDPNVVLWTTSTKAFLQHALAVATQDSDICYLHPCSGPTAYGGSFSPSLPDVTDEDYSRLMDGERSQSLIYLPTVFCSKRAGMGLNLQRLEARDEKDFLNMLSRESLQKLRDLLIRGSELAAEA